MFAADGTTYHDILQPYTAACDKEQMYHDAAGYYTFYDVQLYSPLITRLYTSLEEVVEKQLGSSLPM